MRKSYQRSADSIISGINLSTKLAALWRGFPFQSSSYNVQVAQYFYSTMIWSNVVFLFTLFIKKNVIPQTHLPMLQQ